ncbi:type III pantothenate kinase [Chitinophaga caeni]|uniref:Type III pantothenate kinase n=1 Tax=Chitinophaga caeni TaxID=2029983 RepID=A0A291QR17_9BACT|nr:type III pantothenate kinase [Chitinophaga caeni]ATL46361.1 type III pantothenate kinase [Chitinophaga caeni]
MIGRFLCVDFGNSRQKCALMEHGQLKDEIYFTAGEDLLQQVQGVVRKENPQAVILSSVINHPPGLEAWLNQHVQFIKLGHQTPLPIKIMYDKPTTLGVDRIALSVGAWSKFPGQHSLVIAAGSAITYNFVHKSGSLIGGGISPGIEMRFKALHSFTDQLPLVEASTQYSMIGYNTRQSILSGVMEGAVAEVSGMIQSYAQKYRNFNVLLTGGNLEFFASRLKNKIFADPFLLYQGLNSILELNAMDQS